MNHCCEQCIKSVTNINHSFEKPIFVNKDKLHKDHFTNQKKFDLNLMKCYFELALNNFNPLIKTKLH